MKNLLKTLATFGQEHTIIIEALKTHNVTLPSNYWRIRLAMLFLLRSEVYELPRALRSNFCPLFWFTNVLFLSFPAWGSIYFVCWLVKLLIVEPFDKLFIFLQEKRTSTPYLMTNAKFNRAFVMFGWLRQGRNGYEINLQGIRHSENLNTEEVRNAYANEALYDRLVGGSANIAYFIVFCKHYGGRWVEEYNLIEEEYYANREKKESRLVEKTRRKEAVMDDFSKIFSAAFSWSKLICKAIAIVVAVPLTILLAWLIVEFVILLYGWALLTLAYFSSSVLTMFIAVLISLFVILVIVGCINGFVPDTVGPIVKSSTSRFFSPLRFIGGKLIDGIEFIVDFVSMFYSSNCPGITFDDKKS